mmetsp:Transcript_13413/g.37666  ORF Transcript_13413/g.37666 Transcript_13413/m.37666 type:complete len:270 (-) Transcript_13413:417-1226(-)
MYPIGGQTFCATRVSVGAWDSEQAVLPQVACRQERARRPAPTALVHDLAQGDLVVPAVHEVGGRRPQQEPPRAVPQGGDPVPLLHLQAVLLPQLPDLVHPPPAGPPQQIHQARLVPVQHLQHPSAPVRPEVLPAQSPYVEGHAVHPRRPNRHGAAVRHDVHRRRRRRRGRGRGWRGGQAIHLGGNIIIKAPGGDRGRPPGRRGPKKRRLPRGQTTRFHRTRCRRRLVPGPTHHRHRPRRCFSFSADLQTRRSECMDGMGWDESEMRDER